MTSYTQNPHITTRRNSSSSPYTIPARPRSNSTTSPYNIPERSGPHSYNSRLQYGVGSPPAKGPDNVPLLSREFVVRRISEGESGRVKQELKCEACGKGYKHISSLAKHLWEHTPEWNYTKKLLISKHQQVQLLEAASILVSMNENDKKKEEEMSGAISGGVSGIASGISSSIAGTVGSGGSSGIAGGISAASSVPPISVVPKVENQPQNQPQTNINQQNDIPAAKKIPVPLPIATSQQPSAAFSPLHSPPSMMLKRNSITEFEDMTSTRHRISFNYQKRPENSSNGGYFDDPLPNNKQEENPKNNTAIEDDEEEDSRSDSKSPHPMSTSISSNDTKEVYEDGVYGEFE